MLPGSQSQVQLEVFSVPSLPSTWIPARPKKSLTSIRGPTRGDGLPGIESGSSDLQSTPLLLHLRGGRDYSNSSVTVKRHVKNNILYVAVKYRLK